MLRNSKIGQPHGYLGFTVNHPDKCKVVTAGKAELQNYDYILSNTTLEHVEKEKDIGVTIDSKLTFEHHMNKKINKANSTMGLIRRTFTCLDEETFLLFDILFPNHGPHNGIKSTNIQRKNHNYIEYSYTMTYLSHHIKSNKQ